MRIAVITRLQLRFSSKLSTSLVSNYVSMATFKVQIMYSFVIDDSKTDNHYIFSHLYALAKYKKKIKHKTGYNNI